MKEIPLKNYQLVDGPISLEQIHILSGANYFSAERVIRLRINLNEFDEVFSDEIPNLYEQLVAYIPSLVEHHCSVGKKGGFLLRVKEGTLLGHILEHVALEINNLAGMDVGFGKTRMTKIQGVYNVVYRFVDEVAGVYSGVAAFNLLNSILTGMDFSIDNAISELIKIRNERLLGFSTNAIVNCAEENGILWERLDDYNLVQLGTGKYRKLIRATVTEKTSLIAVETTDDKFRTSGILKEAGYPVPKRIIAESVEEAIAFQKETGKSLVFKPAFGNQGKGISLNISDNQIIEQAFNRALQYDDEVIVQEFIEGKTYRLLVIDHKFVAATLMEPPFVIGNGKTSIKKLVEAKNKEDERSGNFNDKLNFLKISDDTISLLGIYNLNPDSVPEKNFIVNLSNSGSLRLGGKAYDVTDFVHNNNKMLAEHISRILNLDVAGVDIISKDISVPVFQDPGAVIEVNAAPDFKPHILPFSGVPRNVEKSFIEMLFPDEHKTRIPVFSIIGNSGVNLLIEILYFWLSEKGLNTGKVKNNGLYTSGNLCLRQFSEISADDIRALLRDPTLDFAISGVSLKSILQDGLGYKFADIGIVLNMDFNNEEYFSYDHIRDEEDIAYAASVVAEEVYDEGYTILNADELQIASMAERCYSKIAFFTQKPLSELLLKHLEEDGIAASLDGRTVYLHRGRSRYNVFSFSENDQRLEYSDSIIASALAMFAWGESVERISEVLKKIPKDLFAE